MKSHWHTPHSLKKKNHKVWRELYKAMADAQTLIIFLPLPRGKCEQLVPEQEKKQNVKLSQGSFSVFHFIGQTPRNIRSLDRKTHKKLPCWQHVRTLLRTEGRHTPSKQLFVDASCLPVLLISVGGKQRRLFRSQRTSLSCSPSTLAQLKPPKLCKILSNPLKGGETLLKNRD